MLIYETTTTRQHLRRNFRYIILAVLSLVFVGFYIYYKRNENIGMLVCMDNYFNASWTHYIPVYGWLKGMLASSLKGEVGKTLIYMLASLLIAVLM